MLFNSNHNSNPSIERSLCSAVKLNPKIYPKATDHQLCVLVKLSALFDLLVSESE